MIGLERVTLYHCASGRRYSRLPDCAADMLASGEFTLTPPGEVAVPTEHTADAALSASLTAFSAPVAPPPEKHKRPRRAR